MKKVFRSKSRNITGGILLILSLGFLALFLLSVFNGIRSWALLFPLSFAIILIYFACFIYDKIELNYESKEIRRKKFGLVIGKYNINDILEYYIEDEFEHLDAGLKVSFVHINLKLKDVNKEIFEEARLSISSDDTKVLFAEVLEINKNVLRAGNFFYHTKWYETLRKEGNSLVYFAIILTAVVLFLTYFSYIIKSNMSPTEDNSNRINNILQNSK